MTKKLFSLAGIIILGMAFLLGSIAYLGQAEIVENEDTPSKKTVQNHYELPNFIPAVWVGIR